MTPSVNNIWTGPPIWYFAYGSNMKSDMMTKRSISPLDAKAVQLRGHYLTFDVFGIPFSEPCYASIGEFPAGENLSFQLEWNSKSLNVPSICGIAYLITPEDFHRLLSTEGGGIIYDVMKATATVLGQNIREDDLETMSVYTLKAKHPQTPSGLPSLRYMTLFREGAESMDLPLEYLEYLRALPDYSKPREGKEPVGMWIFTYFWRPLIKTTVKLHRLQVDADGKGPRWTAILIVALYQIMWIYHDYIHRHVFGAGDGGKMQYGHRRVTR